MLAQFIFRRMMETLILSMQYGTWEKTDSTQGTVRAQARTQFSVMTTHS